MHKLLLVTLLAGCAPATYAYSFDLTDPGARNVSKPGQRDVMEDSDVKVELLIDPTNFQAVLLDVTNKTEMPLQVGWGQILIIAPEGNQTLIRPDAQMGGIEPQAKSVARLVPFSLPATGKFAEAYQNSKFEVVVPMTIRGVPREYRYHLRTTIKKI